MNITAIECKHKFPKLILAFEKETGKHAIYGNEITKGFKYWLSQKIKYKNLICDDPKCPDYKKEFPSKRALITHKHWHDKERRENTTGKNHYNYGKHLSDATKKKMSESHKGVKGFWWVRPVLMNLKKK